MRQTISVTDLRRRLRTVLDDAARRNSTVVLTRRGQPEAVLVSYREYQRLRTAQTEDALAQFDRAWDRLARLNADVDEAQLAAEIEAARAGTRP